MSSSLQRSPASADSGVPALSFIIGRDPEGRWVAMEEHGLAGGLFVTQDAAAHYAAFETDHRPGAVRLAVEPISLRL